MNIAYSILVAYLFLFFRSSPYHLHKDVILNRCLTRLRDTVYLLQNGRKKICFKVPVATLHYTLDSAIVAT